MSFTVVLPDDLPAGARVVIPLPDGDWVAPPGWSVVDGVLSTVWRPGREPTVTVDPSPTAVCGLCGGDIDPDTLTTSRRGLLDQVSGDPDAHIACYRKAVEVKVSRPGGPADPWAIPDSPAPEPPVPETPPAPEPPGGQP